MNTLMVKAMANTFTSSAGFEVANCDLNNSNSFCVCLKIKSSLYPELNYLNDLYRKIRTFLFINYQTINFTYMRPDLSRVGNFYHNYINLLTEDELTEVFEKESASFIRFLDTIPAEKYDYRYAEDKWTIKEVLQHIIDAERIFSYRALRFARKDKTPLPGFDENTFASTAKADARTWDKLVEEFKVVRRSSELLFNSFDEDQLQSDGISSNTPNYVLSLGFILIGHAIHHQKIIKERYL